MKKVACFLMGCALSVGQSIFAVEPESVEALLLHKIEQVHQYHAEFFQKRLSATQPNAIQTKGIFEFSRPGRFRWEVFPPHQELIISDGVQLWHYEPELEQVSVRDFKPDQDATPVALLSGRAETWINQYKVSDVSPHEKGQIFKLSPKNSEHNLKSIEFHFQGDLISALKIQDTVNQIVEIQFSKIQQNHAIPNAKFEFKPPKGVDVVAAS